MTYLKKYKEEHPGLTEADYRRKVAFSCPHGSDGSVVPCPEYIPGESATDKCIKCWNREIPGTEPTNTKTPNEREDGNMNKNFTKKDLKVGHVVKCRNGNLYMVMFGSDGELGFARLHGQMTMDCYDDELRCVGPGCGEYDIVEVYDRAKLYYTVSLGTDNRKLLWKREEKTCDSCAHKVVCTHVGMCEHYLEKAK